MINIMQETSSSPERQEDQGKGLEVAKLLELVWYVSERYKHEPPFRMGADYGFDILDDYFAALAKRDPEMGHMLISALESQPPGEALGVPDTVREELADDGQALERSDRLRRAMGLPGIDETDAHDQ